MSTEVAIKNLEIQVGQLAKQMAERPTSSFGANTENNPKEECKAVWTRSSQRTEGDQSEEGRADKDREKEEEKKEEKEGEKTVLIPKTKSQLAREARKKEPPVPLKEPPYPLVPSKENTERYFKRFLEIFKGLEITMPFGEALQQMSLYTKFMKDILTKKEKYIDSENIMVGGNCSAVIQRKLLKNSKTPGA